MNRQRFLAWSAVLLVFGVGMRIAHGMGPFYEVRQAIDLYSDPSSRANLTGSPIASAASGYVALSLGVLLVMILVIQIIDRRDGGDRP